MRVLAILALLFASLAHAQTKTTVAPVSIEIRYVKDNAPVPGPWPPTWEACVLRAAAIGDWYCVMRQRITTVAACPADPPEFPTRLDAEGRLIAPALKVEVLADGVTWGPTQEEGYVLTPAPACWVLGWVPYTGKWQAPEGAPVQEPVCRPGECPP